VCQILQNRLRLGVNPFLHNLHVNHGLVALLQSQNPGFEKLKEIFPESGAIACAVKQHHHSSLQRIA
jgi:hypothetical protein